MRSAVLANRSCVASCIVERLLPRGDRTGRPLLLDLGEQPPDLGPGRQAELVSAQRAARPARRGAPPRRAAPARWRRRRRARRAPRAPSRDGSGESSAGRPAGRSARSSARCVAAQRRSRPGSARAPRRTPRRAGIGRVDAVEPVGDRAAERLEQPELVEPPVAAGREPAQLGDDRARPRAARRARPARASSRSVSSSSRTSSSSSSRTARSSRSGSSSKIVAHDGAQAPLARDRRCPPNGSTGSPPASGRAIALIVKSRVARSSSIVPGQRREVDRAPVVERDAPGAVPLRERERRAARAARVRAGRALGLPDGDVEVDAARARAARRGRRRRRPRPPRRPGPPARAQASTTTRRRAPARRAPIRADELVVDRLRDARVVLGEHARGRGS